MFKKNYYCLVAGLPDLFFNENKPVINCNDFKFELQQALNSTDYELIKLFFFPYDNKNLINLLFKSEETFSSCGNFSKEFLETQLLQQIELPEYMVNYIKWVKSMESLELGLQAENKMHSLYYEHIMQVDNSFVHEWFGFELDMKNILAALNCQRYNYEIKQHLISHPTNDHVCHMLLKTRLKPEYYEENVPFAEQIFRLGELDTSMIGKEKAIDKIKWDYLDEATFFHYFTIERILSYMIKLMMVERWLTLDRAMGEKLLEKLIDELKLSYTFPEEFSTVK